MLRCRQLSDSTQLDIFRWLKKYPFAKDIAWVQTNAYVFDQDNGAQHYHQSLEDSCTPQEAWDDDEFSRYFGR